MTFLPEKCSIHAQIYVMERQDLLPAAITSIPPLSRARKGDPDRVCRGWCVIRIVSRRPS